MFKGIVLEGIVFEVLGITEGADAEGAVAEDEGNKKLRNPKGFVLLLLLEGLLCGEPKFIVDNPLLERVLFVLFVFVIVFCVLVLVCGA